MFYCHLHFLVVILLVLSISVLPASQTAMEGGAEGGALDDDLTMVEAFIRNGSFTEAENMLLEIALQHTHPRLPLLFGTLYFKKGDWLQAKKHLLIAVPYSHRALVYLAKIASTIEKDESSAKKYMESAVARDEDDEHVWFEFAMMRLQWGELPAAKSAMDTAQLHSSTVNHTMIGKIYLHYNCLVWAAEQFATAIAMSHTWTAQTEEASLLLAECRERQGQPNQATAVYKSILSENSQSAHALTRLGLLLLGTGLNNHGALRACGINHQRALEPLRAAVEQHGAQNSSDSLAAADALNFCEKEHAEVRHWESVLNPAQLRTGTLDLSLAVVAGPVSVALSRALTSLVILLRAITTRLTRYTVRMQRRLHKVGRTDGRGAPAAAPSDREETLPSPAQRMRQHWDERSAAMNATLARVDLLNTTACADFYETYMRTGTPALLSHFQAHWSTPKGTITKEWLAETFGDAVVRVSVSDTGRFDGPESGSLWGLPAAEEVLVRPAATSMRMRHFLQLLDPQSHPHRTPPAAAAAPTKDTDMHPGAVQETFYIEYLALHQYLGQDFLDLVPFPTQLLGHGHRDSNSTAPLQHLVTNLWIGGAPTTSSLHYDDYANFLCQLSGQKEVILFPPADLDKLYYQPRRKSQLSYTYPGVFTRNASAVERGKVVFGSSVRLDAPDLQRFPLFSATSPVRVLLQPGDVLYLPAYWHHEVQSLPDEETGLNVAVNFWFANVSSAPHV